MEMKVNQFSSYKKWGIQITNQGLPLNTWHVTLILGKNWQKKQIVTNRDICYLTMSFTTVPEIFKQDKLTICLIFTPNICYAFKLCIYAKKSCPMEDSQLATISLLSIRCSFSHYVSLFTQQNAEFISKYFD